MPNLGITGAPSFGVPAADSPGNDDWGDVVGSKDDTWRGDSLYAMMLAQDIHTDAETLVYPSLAAGATVLSGAVAWTWGAYATVVPAGAVPVNFHLLAVQIETCNQNFVFELELYKGPTDDLIAALRFAVAGGFFGNARYPLTSETVEAGSLVRARLASSGGLATITMSIEYHIYP